MGRYTGPKIKLSRREGQDLLLKGSKTLTEKNSFNKKPYAPGQHGTARKRFSEYGRQLRSKQKVKRIYGLLEKQFRNYYARAIKMSGITADNFVSLIERRLDNVVYRSGVASTRAQARNFIRSKKFIANSNTVDIPSYLVAKGDVIEFTEGFTPSIPEDYESPAWVEVTKKGIKIKELPVREDVKEEMEVELIVDFYSM